MQAHTVEELLSVTCRALPMLQSPYCLLRAIQLFTAEAVQAGSLPMLLTYISMGSSLNSKRQMVSIWMTEEPMPLHRIMYCLMAVYFATLMQQEIMTCSSCRVSIRLKYGTAYS